MEVTVSQKTLDHLKFFQRVGSTMKFKKETDYITIVGGDTIAVADIEEVFPRDVCIYNLGEILSLMSVFKQPVLDLSEENVIKIVSDDLKLRYIEGVATNIKTLKNRPSVESLPSIDVEFDLKLEDVKRLNTIISTLKLPYIGFEGKDGKLFFKAFNQNVNASQEEMNNCKILIGDNESDYDEFSFVLSRDVMNYLVDDCKVRLSAQKLSMFEFENSGISVFVTGNNDLTKF